MNDKKRKLLIVRISWGVTLAIGLFTLLGVLFRNCMNVNPHNSLSSGMHVIAGGGDAYGFRFGEMGGGYQALVIISFATIFAAFGIATLLIFVPSFVGQAYLLSGRASYGSNNHCGMGGCYTVQRGDEAHWRINHWMLIYTVLMTLGASYLFSSLNNS